MTCWHRQQKWGMGPLWIISRSCTSRVHIPMAATSFWWLFHRLGWGGGGVGREGVSENLVLCVTNCWWEEWQSPTWGGEIHSCQSKIVYETFKKMARFGDPHYMLMCICICAHTLLREVWLCMYYISIFIHTYKRELYIYIYTHSHSYTHTRYTNIYIHMHLLMAHRRELGHGRLWNSPLALSMCVNLIYTLDMRAWHIYTCMWNK